MKGYTIQDELKKWREPYRIYGGQELSRVAQDKVDVNTTIPEVDRDEATIEAEKGEILLNPKGQIFRILGDSHSKGGTPLNVPEGSFIFSKFKPLAIDKESKELFNFKEGGKYTQAKNVPAKIVEREIDIKHHNKLFKVMDSKFHDKLSKDSAEAMMQKNFTKLGQIAYLQEEIKGFPNGLPEFSIGTAPLGNLDNENIEGMNQYRNGGFTTLKKYQVAGPVTKDGKNYQFTTSVPKTAKQVGYEELDGNKRWYFETDLSVIPNPSPFTRNRPNNESRYVANLARNKNITYEQAVADKKISNDPRWRDIWTNSGGRFINPEYFYTQVSPDDVSSSTPSSTPVTGGLPKWDFGTAPKSNLPVSTPGNEQWYNPQNTESSPKSEDVLPYNPEVSKTRGQWRDLGWAAYQASNINKYYPIRKQYNFTEFNPQLINTQPFIDNIRSQGSSFMQNQRTIDPRFARANNAYAFGQMLESGNEALGQIFNQNVGITNQANQFNVQGRNAVNAQNVDAASDYFDKVNLTNEFADRERTKRQSDFISLDNQQNSMNADMRMKLLTQPTMGTRDVWQNAKTGEISRFQKLGKDWVQKKQAAPLYDWDPRTENVYYTGAGSLDMAGQQRTGQINFQQLDQILNNPAYNFGPRERALIVNGFLRNMMNPRMVQNFAPFTQQ